jgi:hypothetical protein
MNYPCTWDNTETQKRFAVTKSPENIQGTIGEAIKCVAPANVHWGKCTFHVRGTQMDLHVIESHPEKGTGLGSLLMYLLSIETVRNGCTIINNLSAAANERQFYRLMGCQEDISVVDALLAADVEPAAPLEVWPGIFLAPSRTPSTEEAAQLIRSAPMIGYPAEVMEKSLASVLKRWEKVG